jgi:hypothetical protein
MTRSRRTSGRTSVPVRFHPNHRRDWRTMWRRCICGLPAPCIDRVPPAPPPPYPPRDSPTSDQVPQGRQGIYRSRAALPDAGGPQVPPEGVIPARATHPESNVGRAGRLTPAQQHRADASTRRHTRRQPRRH